MIVSVVRMGGCNGDVFEYPVKLLRWLVGKGMSDKYMLKREGDSTPPVVFLF